MQILKTTTCGAPVALIILYKHAFLKSTRAQLWWTDTARFNLPKTRTPTLMFCKNKLPTAWTGRRKKHPVEGSNKLQMFLLLPKRGWKWIRVNRARQMLPAAHNPLWKCTWATRWRPSLPAMTVLWTSPKTCLLREGSDHTLLSSNQWATSAPNLTTRAE